MSYNNGWKYKILHTYRPTDSETLEVELNNLRFNRHPGDFDATEVGDHCLCSVEVDGESVGISPRAVPAETDQDVPGAPHCGNA